MYAHIPVVESPMKPSLSEDPAISSSPAPFSLKGLKETLLKPINYYEKFANSNGSAVEALESALRSVSYILPGRFKDSELVSEIRKHIYNADAQSFTNCTSL